MMVEKYQGKRDPRFVRIQRGGLLEDDIHQELALWSALCAEHVLFIFEQNYPDDARPREAINAARAWAGGEISMMQAREFAYAAHDAAREAKGAAKDVARASGHAVATAHMADHELGGAYYAIRAVMKRYADDEEKVQEEREWQVGQLTDAIRDLVLDDMRLRAKKFQGVFG